MTTFETQILNIAKAVFLEVKAINGMIDMRIKQEERKITALENIASSLSDIQTYMLSNEVFLNEMKELRSAIRHE